MAGSEERSRVMDNSPDWRWNRALYECAQEKKGNKDYTASPDLTVKLAKRFLSLWNLPGFQGAPARELMPGMAFIYDLHQEDSPGCTRHALEAALVAKASPPFIRTRIHKRLTPFVTRTYELLFYDVRSKLGSPFWVEKHIFAPAMAQKKNEALNSDLVWKVVAYVGGVDRLLKDCLRGYTYNGKDAKWIMEHVVSQNARKALTHVHTSDKVQKELTVPARQRTIGVWEDQAYKLDDLGDTAEGVIPAKMATFHKRLKMKDSTIKGVKEERVAESIHKYVDGDLDT